MEKLSIDNVLSLLLPGTFFTASIIFVYSICVDSIFDIDTIIKITDNSTLDSIVWTLVCLVSGAFVQRITYEMTRERFRFRYNECTGGLYAYAGQLLNKQIYPDDFTAFINKDCDELFDSQYFENMSGDFETKSLEIQENYFEYIYHYLITFQSGNESRSEQSFYFLFRNLYTASLIIVFLTFIISVCAFFANVYLFPILVFTFFGYSISSDFIFIPLGRWYRQRMVKRTFYQYYLLKNSFSLKKS